MPPPCSLSSWARTVAGTPNSRDLAGARAPLLSHTTARSRQASTSFESQATRAGRRLESQPTGTSQRYDPGALPSRPGSQRLLTIGRLRARPGGSLAPRYRLGDGCIWLYEYTCRLNLAMPLLPRRSTPTRPGRVPARRPARLGLFSLAGLRGKNRRWRP